MSDVGVVDFPTLGDLLDQWYFHHCTIPDALGRRIRFEQSDWQFWCTANHYRVREKAKWNPNRPLLAQAFTYRQSLVVAPQKTGKGPWTAAITAGEAVGPTMFCGWAEDGDVYRCEDNGCSCGWEFEYEPGEPMGRRRPGPLIQLLASSEEHASNVYGPLSTIVMDGPLGDLMAIREGFIRVLDGIGGPKSNRIDVVSSSAKSRLGQPITFAIQDEVGLYTKQNKLTEVADTQRRGLAGMGGRSVATTNAWDPAMDSYAQQIFESPSKDVFKFYRHPPNDLSYQIKRERRKIHAHVYAGSPWVNLDDIEAEASFVMQTDPTQAERFFGNRVVYGAGSWLSAEAIEGLETGKDIPPDGTPVCGGFDGSMNDDWTAIKLETREGLLFTPTYGPDSRPAYWNPSEWGGQIPRSEVESAWDEIARRYELVRVYCDPGFHDERSWESDIESWDQLYGPDKFISWPTNQIRRMHGALTRFDADVSKKVISLDSCEVTLIHLKNCKMLAKPGDRYILGKPAQNQKIDIAMTAVLAHEAAADARAAGWPTDSVEYVYF